MLEQCRAMMEAMLEGGASSWMSGMMPMGSAMLLVALAWVALLVGVGLAIGWLVFRRRPRRAGSEARGALDVRYARGELDRDTYLEMRSDLTDQARTAG
jgi:uncharacterized membrane protein